MRRDIRSDERELRRPCRYRQGKVKNGSMFRTIRAFISIVITIIELLLSSRLLLRFFAANPRTPFVAWVYGVTAPLVSPFAKIHPDWRLSGFVLDFSTLAALIVSWFFLGEPHFEDARFSFQ